MSRPTEWSRWQGADVWPATGEDLRTTHTHKCSPHFPLPLISCCHSCPHLPFPPSTAIHGKNDNSCYFLSHFPGPVLSIFHLHDSCAGEIITNPILQARKPRHGVAKFTQLVSGRGRCSWSPASPLTCPRATCRQILDMPRAFSGLLERAEPTGAGRMHRELKPQGQLSINEGRMPASLFPRGQFCPLLCTLS